MTRFPIVVAGEGVTRQVLADRLALMVVVFRFDRQDAIGALNDHPHIQSTYVETARFRFSIDEEVREVGPGDSFVIPSGVSHGCECLEPGTLVDCFSARRDDFL